MVKSMALGALALLAATHAAPAALFLPPIRNTVSPRLAGRGAPDHVALTFDDGPHPEATPRVLAALRRHNVRATFFVLGSSIVRNPGLGRALAADGHEVGVHGWDHRCLLSRGSRAVYNDFARTTHAIAQHTGLQPVRVRAPYGVFTTPALVAARRLGLAPVLWTCWGFDWTHTATPASVTTRVLRGLTGGGTILLHDSDVAAAPGSWRATPGALPSILDHCRAHGLTVGPLAEHSAP